MKIKLTLFATGLSFLICSFLLKPIQSGRFDGVWELKEYNYGGNTGRDPYPKQIKVFRDSLFASYVVVGEQQTKSHGGPFRVLNDSVYTEHILTARNTPMIGKTYFINYKIEEGVLHMSGTFDSPEGKVSYSEVWVRVHSDLMVRIIREITEFAQFLL